MSYVSCSLKSQRLKGKTLLQRYGQLDWWLYAGYQASQLADIIEVYRQW
jgi:hypothetical protein